MFYRICNLLALNIELVFVFDGPKCPTKRGRSAGRRVDYKDRQLLKDVLRYFGIPFLEAPSEAEAQCCYLQRIGLVDAVWSQDSDCLMFGCTLWIRDHRIPKEDGYDNRNKAHTKKVAKTVRVVRADVLREKLRLRREGFVLIAMLVGGDYNTSGLDRCGPATAIRAAQAGLGVSLCKARNQSDCNQWTSRVLDSFFKREGINISVPLHFPNFETLQYYNEPLIDLNVDNNMELSRSYRRHVQEIEPIGTTSTRLNLWGPGYMEYVGPTLLTKFLTKFLVEQAISSSSENIHAIELVKRRHPKDVGIEHDADNAWTITFSPLRLTILTEEMFYEHPKVFWNTRNKNGEIVMYDPDYRVECDMPEYLLKNVFSSELNEKATLAKKVQRKRSRAGDRAESDREVFVTKKPREQGRPAKSQPSPIKTPQMPQTVLARSLNIPRQQGHATIDLTYLITIDDELHVPRMRDSALGSHFRNFDQEDADLQKALRLSKEA